MTDYREEQRNELEALESIYPDSFTEFELDLKDGELTVSNEDNPVTRAQATRKTIITTMTSMLFFCNYHPVLSDSPISFTITVTSDPGEDDETVQATFKFTYVDKYPDEAPLYEIVSQENIEDEDATEIISCLDQQVEENLGMVMIFTLVSAIQEKLNEIVDLIKTRREEEKVKKEKEAEEAEKVIFHGTPVTIEAFLSWKAKFDAELNELRSKRQKEEEQAGKNKLTGKKLFETDHNLDTSDIKFLEEAGNSVEVDESLFQDMDDLDLDDDEDDPDFNPADLESD